ncbi:MAG TPA: haloacid dehalogenase type II [Mycobacterium sp.]|nr:haloacid dehalogenase type II [Mycobacterium sp.]
MVHVIAFDVNETLLDLRVLDTPFEELFGDAALRPQWFAQMLQLSFVGGLIDQYVDFSTAQRAALQMIAQRRGRPLTTDEIEHVVDAMTQLPAHPEVPDALSALAASELTVVALTNSTQPVAEAQLANAGIRQHFDRVLSADTVGHLKPAAQPYRAVAEAYDVAIAEVRLVAAHSWDISGALAAGCKAAFVTRAGMVLSPIGPQPDITGADIDDVVQQILRADS